MRPPLTLRDKTPLQDEPFASRFQHNAKRHLRDEPVFLRAVANSVEKAPGGNSAVEAWINLGFTQTASVDQRSYGLRKERGPCRPSKKQIKAFVQFYWKLFHRENAMEFLRNLKFDGLQLHATHSISVKDEPDSPPLSPLTELSDNEDIFVPASHPQTRTVVKVERSSPPLRRTRSQNVKIELLPVIQTPVRDRLRQRPAAPQAPERPGRRLPPPRTAKSKTNQALKFQLDTSLAAPSFADPVDYNTGIGSSVISPSPKEVPTQRPTRRDTEGVAKRRTKQPIKQEVVMQAKLEALDDAELLCSLKNSLLLPDASAGEEAPKSWIEDDQPANNAMMVAFEAQNDSSSSEESAELKPVLDVAAHLPKPPLTEFPPIWAQSRQEVCESFQWFRSYQGGVYHKDGSVKGYFLSAHSAQRDSFECGGKIIISHGGGKSENSFSQRPGVSVTRTAQDQQAQDLSVRALMGTYQKSVPLVLLIDDKYEPFPLDLSSKDIYMTVLGFYRIIHAWAEYQPSTSNANGRVVRYKFAFQWCEDQGQPWWWTQGQDATEASLEDNSVMDVDEQTAMAPTRITMSPSQPTSLYTNCTTCNKASPHVFTLGWVCLNPDCGSFWRYPNSSGMIPDQLEYNPAFLSLIDFRPLPPNYTLAPDPPVLAPKDGIVTAYEHSRGWHCLKCGRLSCRSAWEHYQCPNCQDTQKINGIIRPASTLRAIRIPTFDRFYDSQVEPSSGIERLPSSLFEHSHSTLLGNYQTFVLPDGKGKIHLIKSNRLACDEADKIFEAYQQQASAGTLHFRRWPLRSHKLRGQCLTNYFSQNSGETYHYVGGADNTVPFHRAPAAVLQAHDLIEKRIFEALGKRHKFNEVLSAAYMEKQKMAFHSDSERGLGPVVAGLSMGSPALMHFRALAKFVPRDEQRTTLLTVILRHGDVLMMEGSGVQDFYEHTVVPTNFRIAATARWIEPNHVVEEPVANRRG